jgi:tetratricopeptide (TPR) repeat protein
MYYDWEFSASEIEFQKAILLKPSLASAHHYYSVYLTAMLRPEEAQHEIAKARELDPLSILVATDIGFEQYYDRNYDEAIKLLKDSIAMNPNAPIPHFWLARVYQAKQKYDEALAEFKLARIGWTIGATGHLYGIIGNRSAGMKELEEIDKISKQAYISPYFEALIYLGLGEKEKTFELLDQSYRQKVNWLVWLLKDPRWDPMRSEPRFEEMLRKVSFPEDAIARSPKSPG